jgi:hypothetical protein
VEAAKGVFFVKYLIGFIDFVFKRKYMQAPKEHALQSGNQPHCQQLNQI